jgi:hypothetical protein
MELVNSRYGSFFMTRETTLWGVSLLIPGPKVSLTSSLFTIYNSIVPGSLPWSTDRRVNCASVKKTQEGNRLRSKPGDLKATFKKYRNKRMPQRNGR